MGVKTYDLKNTKIIWNGISFSGFAEGEAIKFKRSEDMYKSFEGADGEVTRVKTNSRRGEIELHLMMSSNSNDKMSLAALLDEATNSGMGAFLYEDDNGTTIATAENAWIRKFPDTDATNKATPRVWMLDADTLVLFLGGNS